MLAVAGAVLVTFAVKDGPYVSASAPFDRHALRIVLANRGTRLAMLGYFGHMWELYAFVVLVPLIVASRLEGANKIYGSHCLVSAPTIAAAGDVIGFREIDRVVVVGQNHPETVFEIMGRSDDLTPGQVSLQALYSDGLAAYRARDWDAARHAFSAALEAAPGDGPSMAFLKRIGDFQANPPAADWDGAWVLDRK